MAAERMERMNAFLIGVEKWSNAACLGYAIKAMERKGFTRQQIQQVVDAMREGFDECSVADADKSYCNSSY